MPVSKDDIPRPDIDFQDWAHNFYAYALTRDAAWQIGESSQITIEAPFAAFAADQNPNHGKGDLLQKHETRKTLEHACL
jgi:hypothetical protein